MKHIRAMSLAIVAAIFIVSVALATDGVLPSQPHSPLRGNYCVESVGVSLASENQTETMTVNVNGTPVAAYLYWSGRYAGSQFGDADLHVAVNGGSPATIVAEAQEVASASYADRYYYTYRSTDLVANSSGLNLASQFTPFTLTVSGLRGDEAHGAGIVVVYENAATCSYGDVHLMYGLDSFHHRFGGLAGPNSEVTCVTFEAADAPRTIDYQLFAGGVEGGSRPDAIWTKTGVGPLPANYAQVSLIDDPAAIELVNPLDGNEGNTPGEWDNHQAQIMVPAGDTYACVQIESVPDLAPTVLGTSAVWVNLAFKVELIQPTPTATATDAATATPTQTATASATATSTPTEVPPTVTPTATATDVAAATPTETATESPTSTPTDVPPTATSTTTATDVATETPTATSTATPTMVPTETKVPVEPTVGGQATVVVTPEIPTVTPIPPTSTPVPPICTSDTDLQVVQAIETNQNKVTITLSYWNSGSSDLSDIYLVNTLPAFTILDASADNSPWQCNGNACRINVGLLSANATSNEAHQVQVHLLVQDGFPAGQTTTVNRAVIFQNASGVQGAATCSTEGAATILLPTALDTIEEPTVPFAVTDVIYLPYGGW